MMCGTIAAVTITAPASIPAAILVGAIGKYGMNFLARQVGSSRFITAHANRLAGTQFSRGIGRFFTGA
ncbi:hypothetical protein Q5Y75_01185 [Ruegeria sp. 2205SS24-7]|uniref:hypothetical protein n=1 Tax=Ruegeria discodermiae TaxID=3064389 RepID=UPI002741A07F|nr:hypothetical protein [Ruegeria sp. 2205SS24-7]MDP5215821.1 hypothetical protein [Ruegeria sp. 2205SS24-7]